MHFGALRLCHGSFVDTGTKPTAGRDPSEFRVIVACFVDAIVKQGYTFAEVEGLGDSVAGNLVVLETVCRGDHHRILDGTRNGFDHVDDGHP